MLLPRTILPLILAFALAFFSSASGCDLGTAPGDVQGPPVVPPTDVVLPDTLRERYAEDAALLTYRHVHEAGGAASRSIELPEPLVETLFNALVAVYALEHPARDSVVVIHEVHTHGTRFATGAPALRDLIVIVDTTEAWVGAWRASGSDASGHEPVDELIRRWDLRVKRWGLFGDWLVLRAARPLNMRALATRFAGIEGVRSAEPNGVGGDGADITAVPGRCVWQLTYSIGWGDCLAGCISRHTWTFRVDTEGRATFVGSGGDPVE